MPFAAPRHVLSFAAALVLSTLGIAQAAQGPEFYDAKRWLEATDSENVKRMLGSMLEIKTNLEKTSHVQTRLLISTGDEINAFATEIKGEKVIVFNLGLLEQFHNDKDAVASVYAHELAHHEKNHIEKGQSTGKALGILSAIVGAVVDYKLGSRGFNTSLGSDVTNLAASLLDRKFSRDQEREADAAGMPWLVAAGYNPEGAIRLHRKLLEEAGNSHFSMLSTHPTSDERIENLQKLIREDAAAAKLAKVEPTPLFVEVEEKDDEDEEEAPVAGQASQPLEMPEAKYLTPVEGISFETYCKLNNEIVFTSEAPATFKKYGLTAEKYKRVNEIFSKRLAEDKSGRLSIFYTSRFLAAAQGQYGKWAQDAANSYATGKPLAEQAPISMEQWAEISVLLEKHTDKFSNYKAMDGMLKPYKLGWYDWLMIQNWWMRKFAMQQTDAKFMEQYMKLRSAAESKLAKSAS
ncbi:M48 family metallopeptidase [Parachitinimonas caeni]|uniref:M48 family metallopeptidase n=1 Tax=Parachitinimonas caeni TaxID=3031301 RepID=A0ABT7E348_9NEIS|nr:M48 family metallopeptidase [Parachitinimonas caeni]MDK2125738.1 M48 family metallopeptidase [Parachitinimonas caeni]